jgi:hypothetical protein
MYALTRYVQAVQSRAPGTLWPIKFNVMMDTQFFKIAFVIVSVAGRYPINVLHMVKENSV